MNGIGEIAMAPNVTSFILLTYGLVPAANPSTESLMDELEASYRETCQTLARIEGPEGFANSRAKLVALGNRFEAVNLRLMTKKNSLQEDEKAKFVAAVQAIRRRDEDKMMIEYRRLSKSNGLLDEMADLYPVRYLDKVCIVRTNAGVAVIDLTLLHYKTISTQKEYPKNLTELTTPPPGNDKALLKIEELTDPWGRPYQFDRLGPKHDNNRPDVWSYGPLHGDASKNMIGNWRR
jgi:hypothetical protein